jgi:hypothetical protein
VVGVRIQELADALLIYFAYLAQHPSDRFVHQIVFIGEQVFC